MSRQIQIRRGSAAENDAFTGAIGEITMDTTNNTLRVHDGETAGGTVLAKQTETNNKLNTDVENISNPKIKYTGEIVKDFYGRLIPKHSRGTVNIDFLTLKFFISNPFKT